MFDTDIFGLLEAFYKSLKQNNIQMSDIKYVMEIIKTSSHSEDGIALILDDGKCFVGDFEPAGLIFDIIIHKA